MLKPFIGKLEQETRFTDACVTERIRRIGLSVSQFSLSVRVSSVRDFERARLRFVGTAGRTRVTDDDVFEQVRVRHDDSLRARE